ncbi:V-type proton ATPase subunit c1 isoform X1 [Capsicum annuum]|uniref:V-type proton ATPase subunit c1 isoform X1 n=1 Tax=Capsicum annuum TaxID=4072 RepID=UPI001FB12055|nr:V-type proton ATPase subunit c1 isoform X1 [Capsicum annuum]
MSTFSGDETAPFFGFLGAAAALVFSCMGAAYGTAKSGVGVASMGVMRPELVMKSIVPVVMAGVLGIYGLIIAVIISTGINPKTKSYYLFDGYAHLSSGLACGLAGLSAGMAIGIVGDAGVSYGLSKRETGLERRLIPKRCFCALDKGATRYHITTLPGVCRPCCLYCPL